MDMVVKGTIVLYYYSYESLLVSQSFLIIRDEHYSRKGAGQSGSLLFAMNSMKMTQISTVYNNAFIMWALNFSNALAASS